MSRTLRSAPLAAALGAACYAAAPSKTPPAPAPVAAAPDTSLLAVPRAPARALPNTSSNVARAGDGSCTVTLLDSAARPGGRYAPPPVAREFRAAWISPVEGGEWPSRAGMSDAEQQAQLTGLLDRAAAIGLNAVILHMRPAADALYPTPKAPWSSYLVRGGEAPSYDPLAFAVREAHRRGLQLHVWFNPFRAAPPDERHAAAGARRVGDEHPEWLVRYGSQQWIDPGFPEARRQVLETLFDVVDRYDVDGLHLDDYFYPYREERTVARRVGAGRQARTVRSSETIAFDDERSWARYGTGGSRSGWRRENVSDFVRQLYAGVKARKPTVLVGISPFGIWRPGSPAGVSGLDAYEEIYADSRRWLREGWLDYLAPQLYWASDGEQLRFTKLDAWWRSENPQHRHLWPGLLTMRAAEGHNRWPVGEIPHEVELLRAARQGSGESQGHVHFRMRSLMPSADGGLGDRLAASLYAAPALTPASPWLGAATPAAPHFAGCSAGGLLTVRAGDATPVRWWLASWRNADGVWETQLLPADAPALSPRLAAGGTLDEVAVSAVSPTGVEGPALVLKPEG